MTAGTASPPGVITGSFAGAVTGGRFHQVRRARAAALLGSLGNQDVWAPLSAALEDRSLAAARALGQIGMAGAARPLLEKLAASRRVPSDIVAHALIELGPGAQGDLIQAASHEEPLVRAIAVEILGRTGAVNAVQTLIGALQGDQSEEVRIRAARAIGQLGTPVGVAPLLATIDAGELTALRAAAAAALGDLGAGAATPRLRERRSDYRIVFVAEPVSWTEVRPRSGSWPGSAAAGIAGSPRCSGCTASWWATPPTAGSGCLRCPIS